MKSEPLFVVDTREPTHTAYAFDGCAAVRAKLDSGDYSVQGLEHQVAVERKALGDFIACCTHERERFWKELGRLKHYPVRAVVVESSLEVILAGAYRSAALPRSILGSALAIQVDFGIPVIFAGDRREAERITAWILKRAWEKKDELGLVLEEAAA
jgi:ERCC4-type nuclease